MKFDYEHFEEDKKIVLDGADNIHDEFIHKIKYHDYSFMYSEDEDVWKKGTYSIYEIKNLFGILIGMCGIDPQELVNECLSLFPNTGDSHELARNEITKWFNEYL